jgi:hypothetical protein
MITSSFVSIPISGNSDYSVPTKREVSGVFPSQTGNDVYIQGNREASIINPTIWSDASFDIYSTVDSQRDYEDRISPTEHPSICQDHACPDLYTNFDGFLEHGNQGSNALFQANNLTNNPMDIFYSGEYFDLAHDNSSGKNSFSEIQNVLMNYYEFYGFRFYVNEIEPLAFEFNFENYVGMYFRLLDPSGYIESHYEWFSTKMNGIVPFVPKHMGNHTLIMYPDTNTVLSSIKLYDQNPLQTIDVVTSGTIESGESTVKFFKFENHDNSVLQLNGLSNHKVTEFDAKLISEYGAGGTVLVYSQHGTRIFGESSSVFTDNSTIFVSVTAEAPYDDVKDRKVNQHFDYPTGVKLDYFFWISQYEIPQLPIGEDFTTEPMAYGGGHNYYYYSTTTSTLDLDQSGDRVALGLNSTGTSTVDFVDITARTVHTISSSSHNFINDLNDDIALFSGKYIVKIDHYETLRFTEAPIQSGSSWTVGSTLDSLHIFYVPATQFTSDIFNVTLLTRKNTTANFRFDFYDSSGVQISDTSDEYGYVTNAANPTYITDETFIQAPPDGFSVHGMYLRITQTWNRIYNATATTPIIQEEDSKTFETRLLIERLDGIKNQQEIDSTGVFQQSSMGSSFFRFLNVANSTVRYWIDFVLDPGAYRYTINMINRSITNLNLHSDVDTYWFENKQVFANGMLELEFAVPLATHFGLQIDIGNTGLNGTIQITRDAITPYVFPSLVLGFVTPNRSPEAKKSDKGPLDFPWFAAVTALSALVVTLQVRRKKFKIN